MKIYTSKEELKDEIRKTYAKFIADFQNIPESMKDFHAEGVDRSPSENLAYHIGWTSLILKWEEDEMMVRVGNLVLFLILEEMLSVFDH